MSLGSQKKLFQIPSRAQWVKLFEEAQRQSVTGVMLTGLERLPSEQHPPKDLLLNWIGFVQVIEQQSKLNEARTKELSSLFEIHGYHTCILKGISVAQLYPKPYQRQSGDIDIWVDGDRREIMRWLRVQFEMNSPVWHNVGVHCFEDIPVEVHFHPSWSWNPFYNISLQRFFENEINKISGVDKKQGYNVPSILFQAISCLSHTYRHLIAEGVGMRHVVDYFYILKAIRDRNDEELRKEILCVVKAAGMRKFLGAMMWVLEVACNMPKDWMLCNPNEKEGRFMLYEIMAAGNFGHQRIGKPLPVNSPKRYWIMAHHFPSEVLWMIPWKVWHKCWRFFYK